MGWLWTSEAIFPWCYGINVGSWLWYMRDTANPRWFYNFALQTWVTY
jgi:hypothetical protein